MTSVDSSCQPAKVELEEVMTFPTGMAPGNLAEAITQPVDIRWKPRPE